MRIGVRVAPVLGPEEDGDDLAARFGKHVKALGDVLWQQRIRRAEKTVIEEYADRGEDLLAVAKPLAPAPTHFAIEINPFEQIRTLRTSTEGSQRRSRQ